MPGTDRPDTGWGFPEVEPYADPLLEVEPPPWDDASALSADDPVGDAPAGTDAAAQEPAPSFQVPRRLAVSPDPVSPLRALAGAAVAVAGVLLGLGALLWATDAPGGSPTVSAGQAQTMPVTAPEASPTPTPSFSAPAPLAVTPTPAASPAQTTPALAPKLAVTVLNNSNTTGLADRAAQRFQAGGWPIKQTGNFTGKVTTTTVYYAPGQLASAERLQQSFTGLLRVRPRFATLPGTGLTVVLTRDYQP